MTNHTEPKLNSVAALILESFGESPSNVVLEIKEIQLASHKDKEESLLYACRYLDKYTMPIFAKKLGVTHEQLYTVADVLNKINFI